MLPQPVITVIVIAIDMSVVRNRKIHSRCVCAFDVCQSKISYNVSNACHRNRRKIRISDQSFSFIFACVSSCEHDPWLNTAMRTAFSKLI